MTAPAEPTPGAPAEPATPPKPAPTPTPPAPPTEDLASLPDWAQKQIRDARAEAGKARTEAKAAAAAEARQALAADVARALGIAGDEPPDPAKLTEQITLAQNQAWTANVELQVHRLAPGLGGDPNAMFDSLAFLSELDDLSDLDPRSEEFRTQLQAKVQAAAARYPAKAASGPAPQTGPRPDPSQGSRGAPQQRPTSLAQALTAHYKR